VTQESPPTLTGPSTIRDHTGEHGPEPFETWVLTIHINRYTTEPEEHGNGGPFVDLEVCMKDKTCSEHDLHLASHVPFSRSWIDRDYTNEGTNPKVCLPRYLGVLAGYIHTPT
jgi:hypothetical protein